MLALMRDPQVPFDLRIDLAAQAAPFVHARPEPARRKRPDPLDVRDRLGDTGDSWKRSVSTRYLPPRKRTNWQSCIGAIRTSPRKPGNSWSDGCPTIRTEGRPIVGQATILGLSKKTDGLGFGRGLLG
jgi:hypothetical protein